MAVVPMCLCCCAMLMLVMTACAPPTDVRPSKVQRAATGCPDDHDCDGIADEFDCESPDFFGPPCLCEDDSGLSPADRDDDGDGLLNADDPDSPWWQGWLGWHDSHARHDTHEATGRHGVSGQSPRWKQETTRTLSGSTRVVAVAAGVGVVVRPRRCGGGASMPRGDRRQGGEASGRPSLRSDASLSCRTRNRHAARRGKVSSAILDAIHSPDRPGSIRAPGQL